MKNLHFGFAGGNPFQRRLLGGGMYASLLITLICIFVPFSPSMPSESLDPSWRLGINQAVAQGLAFGREIAFTFGPYASVYTRTYHPATDHLMMAGSAYLGLSYAFAIFLLARGSRWYLLTALWLVLAGLELWRDSLFFSYPLIVGTLCCLAPMAREERNWGSRADVALTAFLFLPFGLLALIKGTALILCVAVAIIAAAWFVVQRNLGRALAGLGAPALSIVLFWTMSGQSIPDLPPYLLSMLPVAAGYSEAMSLNGSELEVAGYAVAAAILLTFLLREDSVPIKPRAFMFLVFAVYLFLSFKGGFVRHDGHAIISAESILLAGLIYAFAFSSRQAVVVLLVAAAAWGFIASHYKTQLIGNIGKNILSTYHQSLKGLQNRLSERNSLQDKYGEAIERLQSKAPFPVFAGTTDIYSFNQSYLIASGNNWNPRPIFQSYSAYTPALAEANRQHLLSENAPDNVVFRVETIDGRFPSIDDGASWPVLLAHYRPSVLENDFVYLHRNPARAPIPDMPSIGTGTHGLGDAVPVPRVSTPIVAEIVIKPSVLGKLVDLVFKPSQLQISVNLANGQTKRFRLVAGMAKSGFLISPLIENTAEFALLYGGIGYLRDKQVESFSIAPEAGDWQWKHDYEVSFRHVALPTGSEIARVIRFDPPLDRPETHLVSYAEKCDGSIDSLNGVSPAPAHLSASSLLHVHGWLAKSAEEGLLADSVLLVLGDNRGGRVFFRTRQTARPDVAAYFKKPDLDAAGFAATVDVSVIRGEYTLGLAFAEGNRIRICPQIEIPASFKEALSHE